MDYSISIIGKVTAYDFAHLYIMYVQNASTAKIMRKTGIGCFDIMSVQ